LYLMDLVSCCKNGSEDAWHKHLTSMGPRLESSASLQAMMADAEGKDIQAAQVTIADAASSSSSSQQPAEQVDVGQLYTDASELCRSVVAAFHCQWCNNSDCESLEGVSEAAAAGKLCAGCCCRYCSVACQAVDWKRHRRACKRMAAAGQAC
jgi:hypothetical protein